MAPKNIADYTLIHRCTFHLPWLNTVLFCGLLPSHRQLKSPYAIWTVVVVAVGLELFNARHDILDQRLLAYRAKFETYS